MSRGQIFSLDFIIAMSMVILFIGIIITSAEMQNYESKEKMLNRELSQKTEAATIALTNSKNTACELKISDSNTTLAYSIDRAKINNYTGQIEKLKQDIGIPTNWNISLSVDDSIIGETLLRNNIYSIDINVLLCENGINFSDLNDCMNGDTCNLNKTMTLKVGR